MSALSDLASRGWILGSIVGHDEHEELGPRSVAYDVTFVPRSARDGALVGRVTLGRAAAAKDKTLPDTVAEAAAKVVLTQLDSAAEAHLLGVRP